MGSVTVAEWAERYLRTKQHLKPCTLAGYDSLLRKQLLPASRAESQLSTQPSEATEAISPTCSHTTVTVAVDMLGPAQIQPHGSEPAQG